MISLLQKSTLTITRATSDPDEDWGADGRPIDPTTECFDIKCLIQPFRQSNSQFVLPDGKSANDARIVYTATPIRTVNQIDPKNIADTTDIGGLEFEAFIVDDWAQYGLKADHFKIIFIRKDQDKGGSL